MTQDEPVKVLSLIPVHNDEKRRFVLDPIAGKSALQRTIDFARDIERINNVDARVCLVSSDPAVIDACADEPNILIPKRTKDDLREAIKDSLLTAEEMLDTRFDYVFVLEPTNPFRPDGLAAEVLDMLRNDSNLDSVVCAERTHGRVWGGDNFVEPLNEQLSKNGEPPNFFFEMLGLLAASRRHIVVSGHRVGNHVGLVVLNHKWRFIDLQDDDSFRLAELLAPTFVN